MPDGRYARHSVVLVVGLALVAVALGASIAMAPDGMAFRAVGIAMAAMVLLGLCRLGAPAAIAKVRSLATRLRWWHWLWLLVYLSGLVFRVRDLDTARGSPLDVWAGWRIGLMGLVAVSLMARLPGGRTEWFAALRRGLPAGLAMYGLISLVSTLWSVYPLWTLYKSVEYMIDLALLAAILTAVREPDDLKALFDLTWLLFGLFIIAVWLGVIIRPDLALVRGIGLIGVQVQGVFPAASANGVGDLSGVLLVIACTRLLVREHQRAFYWLVLATALPTVILAQSRSPATGALLGLLAVFLLNRRFGLLTILGAVSIVLFAMTGAGAVVYEAFLRGQNPALFASLSGRVGWWQAAWEVFRHHPLLGLGGHAGARFAVLAALGVSDSSSIHNAWLEILLGVGVIGLLPFLATFFGTWFNLLRGYWVGALSGTARELRAECVGIFVMLCFRSIFSVEFIWHPPIPFFLVLGYAELLRRARPVTAPARQPVPTVWARPPVPIRPVARAMTRRLGDTP
jgi:O-antigen ligase